ncbi:hypothetical protein L3Q82_000342 [Scortum barcoo]|uniref:Uncharacterized protein n=1 Tax=Scortum barcoo TaxID=214431 RepID=A0ACB8XAU0_9TELE|nr:hypothetical protein L3Q82_000342 [Scortum barcoo]
MAYTRHSFHKFFKRKVILGLPISEAIDMWGLGCVLIFPFISDHLFSIDCQYQMLEEAYQKPWRQPCKQSHCQPKQEHQSVQSWAPSMLPLSHQDHQELVHGIPDQPEVWLGILISKVLLEHSGQSQE